MRSSLTSFIQNFKSYIPLKNQAIGFDKKILSCLQKNHISRSISSVALRDDHVKSHPNSARTLQAVSKNSLASHLIGRRWYTPAGDHAKHFNFIADAVEIASPAVVCVEVAIQQQGGLFGGGGVAQGAGSGFIVTDYGVILTNAHVVTNSRSVSVKLASGDVGF